jgi:hypothetical protein
VNFEARDIALALAVALGLEASLAFAVTLSQSARAQTSVVPQAEVAIPVDIAQLARGASIGAVVPLSVPKRAQPRLAAERPRPTEPASASPSDPRGSLPSLASPMPETWHIDAGASEPAASASASGAVPAAASATASGGDGDPLAAQQAGMYRGQLDGFFSSRFMIRGKIPFEQLQKLRATVVVDVNEARQVTGFHIARASGDATFDAEVSQTLAALKARGAEVPAPPESRPELLGPHVTLAFQCTARSRCE